jgi:hypothetical protein
MQHHDQEQRQILQHIPCDGGIIALSRLDFVRRHEKPGPVEEDINPTETEQAD